MAETYTLEEIRDARRFVMAERVDPCTDDGWSWFEDYLQSRYRVREAQSHTPRCFWEVKGPERRTICHCSDRGDATLIADALNAMDAAEREEE